MVKALREGKFPLTLKVAVIEEVNGKERKRDIVLEKEVFVISNIEEPAAAAPSPATKRDTPQQPSVTHFEDSSIRFNYVTTEDEAAVATTAKKRFSISGIMSTVGVIVMAMVGFVTPGPNHWLGQEGNLSLKLITPRALHSSPNLHHHDDLFFL